MWVVSCFLEMPSVSARPLWSGPGHCVLTFGHDRGRSGSLTHERWRTRIIERRGDSLGEDRRIGNRRAGIGFWVAIPTVAVLAYPVLLGPCCWISSRTGYGASAVSVIYRPVLLAVD